MFVTTQEMLAHAQQNHYAVGAFNVENLEFVMAVVKAAEQKQSPVILQTTPGTLKYAADTYFAAMVRAAAEKATVPIALHLDHGDSFERCKSAIDAGYTSVMIDGSHENFETNIEITAHVVELAQKNNIPVEAELGRVGGKEDDGPQAADTNPYTDPLEAAEFVARTGCSSLAVGVGTAHGVYKGTPHIAQDVLAAINKHVEIPLVLHGTSGVPDEQVREAITHGICKVNYATELRQAFMRGFMGYMEQDSTCFDPKKPALCGMDEIVKVVSSHMDNLGSSNKA